MSLATSIIIEGVDGAGKETQTKKLHKRLLEEGYSVRMISFPCYDKEHSVLVKMYLNGAFGESATDVDPYIASTFYAADRYASYKSDWEEFSKNQKNVLIFDRYTTSNALFQSTKLETSEREKFLDWLFHFEYQIYKIPEPTKVLFLDVPPEVSAKLIQERENKAGENSKDIHEQDHGYLKSAYDNAAQLINKYNWSRIDCIKDNQLMEIDEIHDMIYENIRNILPKSP